MDFFATVQPPHFTTWSRFWFCKNKKSTAFFPHFPCRQKYEKFMPPKNSTPHIIAVFSFLYPCLKCRKPEKFDFQNTFSSESEFQKKMDKPGGT